MAKILYSFIGTKINASQDKLMIYSKQLHFCFLSFSVTKSLILVLQMVSLVEILFPRMLDDSQIWQMYQNIIAIARGSQRVGRQQIDFAALLNVISKDEFLKRKDVVLFS